MADVPKVSIMVINYNGLKWLDKCLSSIVKTNYPNFDVYLLDNCSIDNSVDYVKANYPWVKVIRYKMNLGFGAACNRAIGMVDAEYIFLLNNDTEILDSNWIENSIKVAIKDETIAAIACKMVSMKDHSKLDSVGGMGIPFWRGFVDIGLGELDQGQYDHRDFEPFSICGGATLLKRDIVMALGGFDEKFFMYFEDADFSWRLKLMKYKIKYAPDVRIAHYRSGTSGIMTFKAWRLFLCHRNLLRAILKNCSTSLYWALKNYLLFSLIIIAGFGILEPEKSIAIIKAIIWNLFQFKDTYAQRLRIQTCRIQNEEEILKSMYLRIKRYQPVKLAKLRDIINILFEHSQSQKFSDHCQ
ncbi:MAG: glycosyltransferase [Candidatus Bathyarchaeota archaeon]|nr:glycosyltransferase [Candidatus Bathyarchaeota archaeon]